MWKRCSDTLNLKPSKVGVSARWAPRLRKSEISNFLYQIKVFKLERRDSERLNDLCKRQLLQ